MQPSGSQPWRLCRNSVLSPVAEAISTEKTSRIFAWVWAGETPAYNRQMTADFLAQMAKLEGQRFDAAFLPLDPRQEADYARGFDCFMRRTRTAQGWPMHFWGDESVFDRLTADPCSEPYRERIAPVSLYHRTAL